MNEQLKEFFLSKEFVETRVNITEKENIIIVSTNKFYLTKAILEIVELLVYLEINYSITFNNLSDYKMSAVIIPFINQIQRQP